jgi:hypothetical protein
MALHWNEQKPLSDLLSNSFVVSKMMEVASQIGVARRYCFHFWRFCFGYYADCQKRQLSQLADASCLWHLLHGERLLPDLLLCFHFRFPPRQLAVQELQIPDWPLLQQLKRLRQQWDALDQHHHRNHHSPQSLPDL